MKAGRDALLKNRGIPVSVGGLEEDRYACVSGAGCSWSRAGQ